MSFFGEKSKQDLHSWGGKAEELPFYDVFYCQVLYCMATSEYLWLIARHINNYLPSYCLL